MWSDTQRVLVRPTARGHRAGDRCIITRENVMFTIYKVATSQYRTALIVVKENPRDCGSSQLLSACPTGVLSTLESPTRKITVSIIMRVNAFSPLFGMIFMKVISLLSTTVSADCCHLLGGGNLGGSWCAGSSTHILSNPSNLDGSDPTPFCGHGGKHLVYLTYPV